MVETGNGLRSEASAEEGLEGLSLLLVLVRSMKEEGRVRSMRCCLSKRRSDAESFASGPWEAQVPTPKSLRSLSLECASQTGAAVAGARRFEGR